MQAGGLNDSINRSNVSQVPLPVYLLLEHSCAWEVWQTLLCPPDLTALNLARNSSGWAR